MKTLYIVRHAKSSWDHDGLTDFERPLNKRGQNDAPMMGTVLREREAQPSIIRTSAANRAITTARLLAEALDFPLDKIEVDAGMYGAGTLEIVAIVQSLPDEAKEVMLVGHNPTIHLVAQRFAGFDGGNVPTCGIFCIDFDVSSWMETASAEGRLRYYEYPKKQR
jgi:phosphohistidine phosphatase